MNKYRLLSILYYAGMLLIFCGIVMQMTNLPAALGVYAAGLIPFTGIRIYNFSVSISPRKRINAILLVSALSLIAAGVAIYFHRSYWIIFIAITAILDGYASFRKIS
ncbi:hypothetical protein [Thermophagus xiamenensis]|uniref:Uncharacterized protein n=1 Tax=Thermophagus xiamenensis TaxID=385682 RepID=A0A1I2FYS9_9BACT|nr:hypothetical protein [Thermophagus xiamenensis]SFF09870.1 hypothetical protein SAMN05444380_1394 [Thermophagus xiamenensis]